MRKDYLKPMSCSMKPGMVGAALTDMISGEVLQKGLVKLGLSLASPDACLLPKGLHVEAHLLDLLSDAGAPPLVRFFSDAGGNWRTIARDRE
jgi:hypothetical protein